MVKLVLVSDFPHALAQPQEVFYEVEDNDNEMNADEACGISLEMHTQRVQSCFRTTGSSGPYKTCAPMDTIFARYFGNDFIAGCFYS